MDWKGKRVFVTGGGGFIGSHLLERLVAMGVKPRVLVRYNSRGSRGWIDLLPDSTKENLEIATGNICDSDIVRQGVRDIDVIFHLAALVAIPYSYRAPQSFLTTNVMGTLNLLQSALQEGVERFIHTSTSEVYGTAQYVPMDEKHPIKPQSPYAASKASADAIAQSFYFSYDLPVTVVRPFNAFGPRQTRRAVIPTVILQCLRNRNSGKAIKIGNLDARRDLTFVKDTVEGFIKIAETDSAVGETINIGVGTDHAIKDLLEIILKEVGANLPIEQEKQRFRPTKSEVLRLQCNNEKIKTLCGWEPQYSLDEGIRLTIDWFEKNLQIFDADTYRI